MLTKKQMKIWDAGNELSGGFGFWGSLDSYPPSVRPLYAEAFIKGLTEAGYSPCDIVLVGDTKEGRWVSDSMNFAHSPKQLRDKVVSIIGREYGSAQNARALLKTTMPEKFEQCFNNKEQRLR
jgi:hypothetical protein